MSAPTTQINFIDAGHAANSTASGAAIVTKIVVGCSGNIFLGTYGLWSGVGSNLYNATSQSFSTVTASQTLYIVDGTAHTSGTLISVSMINGAYQRIQTGSAGQPPAQARIVGLYRNRLVLTQTVSDDFNWFMSEVNNYTSFDYSVQTVIGAVAGNNSDAGKIGDSITAFCPVTRDYAVFGCTDSVWMLRGDPKSGGRIDNLLWGGGIVGRDAWARDPEGNMYYLSRTDLMRIAAGGGPPVSVSGTRLQSFFKNLNFTTQSVRLVWDTLSQGLWMFFTQATAAANTDLFWDRRLDAFSTHTFPNTHGPTAVKSLSGETYFDRQILLGGFDGLLRTFAPDWTTDDGTAISSRLQFTPTSLADPAMRAVLTETELVLGDVPAPEVTMDMFAGQNAQQAMTRTDSAFSQKIVTTGRLLSRSRAIGQMVVLQLSNSTLARRWAFELGSALSYEAGRTR